MQTLSSSPSPLALLSSAQAASGPVGAGPEALPQADSADGQGGFSSVLASVMPPGKRLNVAAGTGEELPPALALLPLAQAISPSSATTAAPVTPLLSPDAALLPSADGDLPDTAGALLGQIGFGSVAFRPAVTERADAEEGGDDSESPLAMDATPLTPVMPTSAALSERPDERLATDITPASDVEAQTRMAAVQSPVMDAEPADDTGNPALELNPADIMESEDSSDAALKLAPAAANSSLQPSTAQTTLQSAMAAAASSDAQPQAVTDSVTTRTTTHTFSQELSQAMRNESLEFGSDRREWGNALGARIVTMVANDIQQARIQLDPPELGSLEIRLQVQQDQATVQVQAQNAQVREVLESSAQRLRDALAGQGIQLSGFDVSERGQQQGGQGDQPSDQPSADGEWVALEDDSPAAARPANSLNLLDTFA